MKTFLSFIILELIFFNLPAIIIPYGNVSGVWNANDSPYRIEGDITIPSDCELFIEAGVEIIFMGQFRLKVYGRLSATGTETDSIRFNAEDINQGWRGLRFYNTNSNDLDSCHVEYCVFTNGKSLIGGFGDQRGGAVYCYNSSRIRFEHCLFQENEANYGGAMALSGSNPVIKNCYFKQNTAYHDGGALICSSDSSPLLENVQIDYNECYYDGGGIFCSGNSSPLIRNCILEYNQATDYLDGSGGGLSCWDSDPTLEDVIIRYNQATQMGGGIECSEESNPFFSNLMITNNNANEGGGIGLNGNSVLNISASTIRNNSAGYSGGGIFIGYNSNIVFDENELSSVYLNNNDPYYGSGFDFFALNTTVTVVLDTFTVVEPTSYFAYPLENFDFEITTGFIQFVEQDVYVSPYGSASASGLSPDDPIRSIMQALIMIQPSDINPLVIHLAAGNYSSSSCNQNFPLHGKDYLSIEGESIEETVLDAENKSRIFNLYELTEFSIKKMTLKRGFESYGGGISLTESFLNLEEVKITECEGTYNGGAIYTGNSTLLHLKKVDIKHNHSCDGGGIYSYNSNLLLDETTICNNYARYNGGGIFIHNSELVFDPVNLSSIYLNESYYENQGNDIWSNSSNNFEIIVDTFTVLLPDEYYVYPIDNYSFDIQNAAIQPVDADLYVNPNGSDSNSGLTPEQPLRTIKRAFQTITGTNTIFLAAGIYSPSSNGELFPVKFKENISLEGNNINTSIIDGEYENSIFNINSPNCTIKNLNVKNANGRGLYLNASNIVLENLKINNNLGGGIHASGFNPLIYNCIIANNTCTSNGGGIYLSSSNAILIGTSINNNISEGVGGGLYCYESNPVFNPDDKCNIYSNYSNNNFYPGHDLASGSEININIIVDTFSVCYPNNIYAYPFDHFTFSIENACFAQIEADLYVSPSGSDSNSGLYEDQPLRHIRTALERIHGTEDDPRTIHLDSGTYSLSTNSEKFPVLGLDNIIISGSSMNSAVLNADKLGMLIYCENNTNLEIKNMTLKKGKTSNYFLSAGIYFNQCDANINNIVIKECEAKNSTAINSDSSELTLENVYIINNEATYWSNICSGIYFSNCDVIMNKVSIAGNYPQESYAIQLFNTDLYMVNSICWNEEASEIKTEAWGNYNLLMAYNCLQGGQEDINNMGANLIWNEGNISDQPLFTDPDNQDYSLQEDSPCIDSGIAYYVWDDLICSDLEENQYTGDAPDMGAYEYGLTSIDEPEFPNLAFKLNQNYPNPFNPYTIISYQLPKSSKTTLSIYNLKGQLIRRIVNDIQNKGFHEIIWDGKDRNNNPVASGIYFYKLKTEDKLDIRKMILIK